MSRGLQPGSKLVWTVARRGAIRSGGRLRRRSVDEAPAWVTIWAGGWAVDEPRGTAAGGLRHFGASVGAEDSNWKVLFGVTTEGPTFCTVLEDL